MISRPKGSFLIRQFSLDLFSWRMVGPLPLCSRDGDGVVADILRKILDSLRVVVAEVGGRTNNFRTLHVINWDTSCRVRHTQGHGDS